MPFDKINDINTVSPKCAGFSQWSLNCPFSTCKEIACTNIIELNEHLNATHKEMYTRVVDLGLLAFQSLDTWLKNVVVDDKFIEVDSLNDEYSRLEAARREKLDLLISIQENEKENPTPTRCFICFEMKESAPATIVHLRDHHSFLLGSPINQVFIKEFIKILDDRASMLYCMSCRRQFPTKSVLEQHRHQKRHFYLHRKLKAFDKYYFIRYLDILPIEARLHRNKNVSDSDTVTVNNSDTNIDDPKEKMHIHSYKDNLNNTEENGKEKNMDIEKPIDIETDLDGWESIQHDTWECIGCDEKFQTIPKFIVHLEQEHEFDLISAIKEIMHDDFYSVIMFINSCRSLKPTSLNEHYKDVDSWKKQAYLKSTCDDSLLWHIDEILSENASDDTSGIKIP